MQFVSSVLPDILVVTPHWVTAFSLTFGIQHFSSQTRSLSRNISHPPHIVTSCLCLCISSFMLKCLPSPDPQASESFVSVCPDSWQTAESKGSRLTQLILLSFYLNQTGFSFFKVKTLLDSVSMFLLNKFNFWCLITCHINITIQCLPASVEENAIKQTSLKWCSNVQYVQCSKYTCNA